MFRKILFIAAVGYSSLVSAQANNAQVKSTEKPAAPSVDYTLMGAPMPPLVLQLYRDTAHPQVNSSVSKELLTGEDVKNKANLFVLMVNPTCSHCQNETSMMGRNKELFRKSKVVLVVNPVQEKFIGTFVQATNFWEYPFYVGIDSSGFTKNAYLYKALPQINIYDKHRRLIKTFNGDVAIDSLKPYIE